MMMGRGRGKQKRPPVVVGIPEERRVTSMASAFRRALRAPLVIANTAGAVSGFAIIVVFGQPALTVPLLFRIPSSVAAFAAVACLLLPVLVRGRVRAALETFAWIGRWDAIRWREATGVRPPASPEQARDWLEANPTRGDAPPLERLARIEPLLMTGDVASARKIAASLPTSSPWDRFETANQRALVEFAGGARMDLKPMSTAIAGLTDPEEKLLAQALVALAKSRFAYAEKRDWIEPLDEMRPRIGQLADGVLRLEVWPALFRLEIVVAVVAGLLLALIIVLG
jgi:hypothetical protein